MPNKQAKINKRKRIIENKRLNREGRTAAQIERKKIRVNETMGINSDFKVILFKNDTSSRFTIRTGPVTA